MLLTGSIVRDAEALAGSIASAVVASDQVTRVAVISLLARGHLLLSDVPGVGKTLLARAVAASINGDFKRIQFTPDLLPTDITGSSIFLRAEERFEFMPGPIFANFVLADEINRASARTQSALLEAMAEGQVSVDGTTQRLPDPFWVVATQNEVDGYGTYPLPQAQLDRFIASMSIGYPDVSGQVTILERNEAGEPSVEAVLCGQASRDAGPRAPGGGCKTYQGVHGTIGRRDTEPSAAPAGGQPARGRSPTAGLTGAGGTRRRRVRRPGAHQGSGRSGACSPPRPIVVLFEDDRRDHPGDTTDGPRSGIGGCE